MDYSIANLINKTQFTSKPFIIGQKNDKTLIVSLYAKWTAHLVMIQYIAILPSLH